MPPRKAKPLAAFAATPRKPIAAAMPGTTKMPQTACPEPLDGAFCLPADRCSRCTGDQTEPLSLATPPVHSHLPGTLPCHRGSAATAFTTATARREQHPLSPSGSCHCLAHHAGRTGPHTRELIPSGLPQSTIRLLRFVQILPLHAVFWHFVIAAVSVLFCPHGRPRGGHHHL